MGRDLSGIIVDNYDRAYRTAYLVMRDASAAEEAVQEAFLRVWRFRDALPAGDAIQPWLYRVLVNTCYSQLRKDLPRYRRTTGDEALDGIVERGVSPEAAAIDASVAATVLDSLAALPDSLRVPVVLRYWTGLSEKEIALAIRRRPGTVKSRLHEARRRLADDPRLAALVGTGTPDTAEEAT